MIASFLIQKYSVVNCSQAISEGIIPKIIEQVPQIPFQVAKSDPVLLPTYHHIVTLHYTCAEIVETLRTIGTLSYFEYANTITGHNSK